MVMIKILKNGKYVDINYNSVKWINIYKNDVIAIETRGLRLDYEVVIFVDGINIINGKKEDIFKAKRFKCKKQCLFYKHCDDTLLNFKQKYSDYSIANDGDPKRRGIIEIGIFEEDDLIILDKIYYFDNDFYKGKDNVDE